MIQVTLNFVSIDALIGALREIPENALVVGQSTVALAATTQVAKEVAAPEAPAPKPRKGTTASTQATGAPSQPTAEAAGAAVQEPSTPGQEPQPSTAQAAVAASAVDYPTLQKAVFTLAGKSRDAALAVFASLGVANAKALPEARWAEALTAVNNKLAELEAA